MTTKITIAEPKANTQPIEKFKCGEVVTFTPDNEDAKIFAMVTAEWMCDNTTQVLRFDTYLTDEIRNDKIVTGVDYFLQELFRGFLIWQKFVNYPAIRL